MTSIAITASERSLSLNLLSSNGSKGKKKKKKKALIVYNTESWVSLCVARAAPLRCSSKVKQSWSTFHWCKQTGKWGTWQQTKVSDEASVH